MKYIILDVQGFRVRGMFIPKELAALTEDWKTSHFVFEPPMPYQMLSSRDRQIAEWLKNFHHSINWEEGYTPMNKIHVIIHQLTQNCDKVYVRGLEKSDYIKQFVGNKSIVETVDVAEQIIKKQTPMCPFHINNICICAVNNVYALKSYCDERLIDSEIFVNNL